jgi:hypothetical protein
MLEHWNMMILSSMSLAILHSFTVTPHDAMVAFVRLEAKSGLLLTYL